MKPGNVLSEYGIVLGLLAVISIGTLTLLGDSKAKLLGNVGQNVGSTRVQNMMQLKFNTSTQDGGGKHQANTGNTSLVLLSNNSGSGVNATSIEGQKRDTTYQTISYANELQAIADSLPNGSDLQLWLTMDLIPRVRTLAAVEGYAANISSLQDEISGAYNADTAFADLTEIRNQLIDRTQKFTYMKPGDKAPRKVYPSPELKATIVGILNQAAEGTKTFGVTSEPGAYTGIMQIATAYDPNTTKTNLVNRPYSQSSGYLAIVQSVQQAQVDNSINQNTETATTAEDADKMEDAATKLP